MKNKVLVLRKKLNMFRNIKWILMYNSHNDLKSSGTGAMFTIFEIENFIKKLEDIVTLKKKNLEFSRYEFSSSEGYFEFIIYDPLEENEAYIEIWINTALNSEGVMFGYDDGVRFVTTIECLDCFKNELKNQLHQILDLQINKEN